MNKERDGARSVVAGATGCNLSYELPKLVDAIQKAWTTTFQAAAVVSALLAANAINLLVLFKDGDQFPQKTCPPILLILAYLSIVTNSCATMTSLVLTDIVGELSYRSACADPEKNPTAGYIHEDMMKIMQRYGAPKGILSWRFFIFYWLFLLVSGFVITVAELLLFILVVEVKSVMIALYFLIILFCIPPFLYFLPRRQKL